MFDLDPRTIFRLCKNIREKLGDYISQILVRMSTGASLNVITDLSDDIHEWENGKTVDANLNICSKFLIRT